MDDLDLKINNLYNYYRAEKGNPILRNLVRRITAGQTTDWGRVQSIVMWMRENLSYQPEPKKLDIIVSPLRVLSGVRRIDCEDYALLFSTLAGIAGIPTKWRVVGQGERITWTHIYPLAKIGASWVPIDLTVPIPLGHEVPYTYKRDYQIN